MPPVVAYRGYHRGAWRALLMLLAGLLAGCEPVEIGTLNEVDALTKPSNGPAIIGQGHAAPEWIRPKHQLEEAASPRRHHRPSAAARSPERIETSVTVSLPEAATQLRSPHLEGCRLIWADEFDGDRLDTSKWTSGETSWGDATYGQHEILRPENAAVDNGILQLIARWEDEASYYSGAAVHTRDSLNFSYGRVEIRARYPAGNGLWSALWLLHDNYRYAETYEINILEVLGNSPDKIHQAYHWYPKDFEHHQLNQRLYQRPGFYRGWHVYALEWSPTHLRYFVDGRQTWECESDGVPISDRPMHIIMNLAIGGWNENRIDESTTLPAVLEIDYVRVYEILDS